MSFCRTQFIAARFGGALLFLLLFSGAARAQTPTPKPASVSLSLRVAQSTLDEGQSITATVSRTGSTAQAVSISFSSSPSGQFFTPRIVIPAGRASTTFTLTTRDNGLVDVGNRVRVRVEANGFLGAATFLFIRNTTPLRVTLEPERTTVREGSFTTTIEIILRRNFAFANAVTVFPSSSDPSRLTVPERVIFAAGSTMAKLFVRVVDNQIVDGNARVTISVSKPNTTIASSTVITVEDDDVAALRVSIEPAEFSEGDGPNAAVGTVTRTTNPAAAMTVTLASSDPGKVKVPATVIIAAGQSSATFPVGAVDDDNRDGTRQVTISAIKTGLQNGSFVVTVRDDETGLSLRVSPTAFSETAGPNAAIGTVRRGSDVAEELVVTLSQSPSLIVVPRTVTIPAGAREATFTIGAVDNQTASGPRQVTISASAENFGTAFSTITVLDDDRAVELRLGNTVFSEANGGNATNASVVLSEVATADIIVPLSADKPGQLAFPSSVKILRGQQSAGFVVRAIDDSEDDGLQTVTITASAEGFRSDSVVVSVFDNDGNNDSPRLTLEITPITFAENAGNNAAVGTVRRNTLTGSGITVTLVSSDSSIARVPPTVTIPAGSDSASFSIAAVDNDQADGTRTVLISAVKASFEAGQVEVAVTDDESAATPMTTRANAKLSTLRADVARSEINLTFTSPIDANLAAQADRYAVEINGARVTIESVAVAQSTLGVRLQLPSGVLSDGARVRVWWALSESKPARWSSAAATAR